MLQDDTFDCYSSDTHGDLEAYLDGRDQKMVDNKFRGSQYYRAIKDLGIMIVGQTSLRVARSPAADFIYVVNKDYMLESEGPGEINMNAIEAPKGVYDPDEVLEDQTWSISSLDFWKDYD